MKQGILSDSGPIKKGVLPSTFFEKARDFLAEKAREQTKGNPDAENLIKILENIDRIQYTVEDVSDATVSKLLIAMKNEDEAKNLKEMAEGFIALLKFLSTYGNDIDEIGKHAIAFITQIQIEQNGNSVSASCRSNSPELRAALKSLFAKVTEDLK